MSNNILKKSFNDKASVISDKNAIIILKGIPLEITGEKSNTAINLENISKNKLQYFFEITKNRNYLTYEEFLLLYDFVVSQYSIVYIINNNIYMDQYPIELCCSDEIKSGLKRHFDNTDDNEESDDYIGNISEFISLFVGLKENNGYFIASYCDDKITLNNKIVNINLFDEPNYNLKSCESAEKFIEIVDESDYVDFVKKAFNCTHNFFIRISNYTADAYKLKSHLKILASNFESEVSIFLLQNSTQNDDLKHKDEYIDILKKYWGYSSFKMLQTYDLNRLDEHKKIIVNVSQERIISNIVEQVENCNDIAYNSFRDVFVTAPTGAGKSVMFQIPAIYLAEKHNFLTIVISPLIGLMNDQVKNLELKNYRYAETINSDISPILKQEIIEKVSNNQCHILYISPETLLSRSDVEQLIGNRAIGMIVIDEAHIVTTWGKQFRPDYWYLGDHIRKLRQKQIKNKGQAFVIATFTATAIYHGLEDMYTETINSLHMINPITYLGYVKRDNIKIDIKHFKKEIEKRNEYELDKLQMIEEIIKRAIITNKKTLIYFPTVALIDRCYEYLRTKRMISRVAVYHGSLSKEDKLSSYEDFYSKKKLVMLATKAFGMGIDINDIELVVHFAPTGNVCDYVQEIGRGARKKGLTGEAYYQYNSRDFKHINRLHGMSSIKKYQLIEVIKKIDELYTSSLNKGGRNDFTKKRNAMLLDAENFTYIFSSPVGDEDSNINKVKTALLIIQKDFENKIGFSPINVRPIPLFSKGFFKIDIKSQTRLLKMYPGSLEEIHSGKHICRIALDTIWRKDYSHLSFPKFKYLLYSKSPELKINNNVSFDAALCVSIDFSDDYNSKFEKTWGVVSKCIHNNIVLGSFISVNDISNELSKDLNVTKYKARSICEVLISSMNSYRKNFSKSSSPIVQERFMNDGNIKYQFNVAVDSYFNWVKNKYKAIINDTEDGELYIINDGKNYAKEISVVLGILECIDVLSFEMIGGANSQLYIYINQVQSLKNILNNPSSYKNNLLKSVADRHLLSVKMLTFLYEGKFSSDEIWCYLEDYFLGVIPDKVKQECINQNLEFSFDH